MTATLPASLLPAMLAKQMSESDLAARVHELFDLYGWTWQHQRPALKANGKWATPIAGHAGFPDEVAVREGRLILAELKRETGRLSQAQTEWLIRLNAVSGVEYYVWRPSDLERIASILR